jgi:hypothetical protein
VICNCQFYPNKYGFLVGAQLAVPLLEIEVIA